MRRCAGKGTAPGQLPPPAFALAFALAFAFAFASASASASASAFASACASAFAFAFAFALAFALVFARAPTLASAFALALAICSPLGAARAAPLDPLSEASSLLASGQPTLALPHALTCACTAVPCTERSSRCALVLGRAQLSLRDASGAARSLKWARAELLGPLAAWAAVRRGEALLLSGQAKEAAQVLFPVPRREGPAGLFAGELLADALLASGEPTEALRQVELMQPLVPAALRGQLRWVALVARVQALEQRTREGSTPLERKPLADRARETLTSFWANDPDHPGQAYLPVLRARLAALGSPDAPPTPVERLQRSERMLDHGLPRDAGAEAMTAREGLTGLPRLQASLMLAKALAADGRRDEAAPFLTEAFLANEQRVGAPAGLLLARAQARTGNDAEAIRTLDALLLRFPDAPQASDGASLAARLLRDNGRTLEAHQRLLALSTGRGLAAADARWTLAWTAYRAHGNDAEERFATYAARAEDDDARAQGHYWQGRAGPEALRRGRFQQALALDPLGYTGVLARAALGQTVGTPVAFPPAPRATASENAPNLRLAQSLQELGLLAESALETEAYVHAHAHDAAALLPALDLYERAGRFDQSVRLAQLQLIGRPLPDGGCAPGRTQQAVPDPVSCALLAFAHPAAYASTVANTTRRLALDPYLLLAVVGRESLFKPEVRSQSGAVGLLQLLPITATRAALVLGRRPPDELELTDPAVALDLGAWYLAELLGKTGDAAPALASYNAGPRAAGPWIARGRELPLDEWVEEIPYRETRHYVKAVIGAWSAYRLLAGGTAPKLAARLPAGRAGVEF